jgi:hypothetical protein
MKIRLDKKEVGRASCIVYSYRWSHSFPTNIFLDVSDILCLHSKLKKQVGIKNLYRNGLLTENNVLVQFGNGFSKKEKIVLKEEELKNYANLKVSRFDFNYLSIWNAIFIKPSSFLNKICGYNENRGSTVMINHYPSYSTGKKIFIIDIKSSKKKLLKYAKKCLEEILDSKVQHSF